MASLKFIAVALQLLSVSSALSGLPRQSPQISKQPLSYGILVDNSKSLVSELGRVKAAAKILIEANSSGDETFLVFFEGTEDIGTFPFLNGNSLSGSQAELVDFLDQIQTADRKSGIVDVSYLSSDYLIRKKDAATYRRALILITDGREAGSHYSKDMLLKAISGRLPIFVLGLSYVSNKKANGFLKELSQKSGGELFLVEQSSDIEIKTKELLRELRKN